MAEQPKLLVSVCQASECSARGSDALYQQIRQGIEEAGAVGRVIVRRGGCWGLCNLGPNVVVRQGAAAAAVERDLFGHDGSFLGRVGEFHYPACTAESVQRIVAQHLLDGHPVEELTSDRALRATAQKLSSD